MKSTKLVLIKLVAMLLLAVLAVGPRPVAANPGPWLTARARLDADQTVPPTDSPAVASVDIVGLEMDSAAVSVYCWDLPDSVTAIAIWRGAPGTNGEIVLSPPNGGFPCGTYTKIAFGDSLVAWLRAGELYIQIQTRAYPDGEVRGRLVENW